MVINLLKSNHSNPQAKLEVLQRRVRLLQSLHELRQTQLQDCFANIEVMNGYSKWIWPFFGSSMTFAYILQFYSTSKCESSQPRVACRISMVCLTSQQMWYGKMTDVNVSSLSSHKARRVWEVSWLKSGFSRMEMSWIGHMHVFRPPFSCIPINEVQKKGTWPKPKGKDLIWFEESPAAIVPNVRVNSWVLQCHYLGSISMHVTSEAPNLVLFEW